ncbi:hypothetical protein COCNU_13G007560 [Cocos nucifera]|uniref:Uncharacterized protein n=1 Tax=Cocos nucifera TaxID=13894 RepID=A0A8K0ITK0_COCNU|nr:hypothetical protein COCNU_13G007560 [Cocos nucifera]
MQSEGSHRPRKRGSGGRTKGRGRGGVKGCGFREADGWELAPRRSKRREAIGGLGRMVGCSWEEATEGKEGMTSKPKGKGEEGGGLGLQGGKR